MSAADPFTLTGFSLDFGLSDYETNYKKALREWEYNYGLEQLEKIRARLEANEKAERERKEKERQEKWKKFMENVRK